MHVKSILAILFVLTIAGCGKEQQVIFEAQSISYKKKYSYKVDLIQAECNQLSKELDSFLKKGWKVVASSPKEKVVANSDGLCVGTEYIVEK